MCLRHGAAPIITYCVLATHFDLEIDTSLVPTSHVGKLRLDRFHVLSRLFFQASDEANIPSHVFSLSLSLSLSPPPHLVTLSHRSSMLGHRETSSPCPATSCPGACLPRNTEEPDSVLIACPGDAHRSCPTVPLPGQHGHGGGGTRGASTTTSGQTGCHN